MDFKDYQKKVEKSDRSKRAVISIYGFMSEVGSIFATLKKRFINKGEYPNFKEELIEELGDCLWYLSSIATRYGLSLEKIAESNLNKAKNLFNEGEPINFDQDYPEDEQFPRYFEVEFREAIVKKRAHVKISINGIFVGDPLTDNSYDPKDGYRYHDVFHLSYAAVLGWSPIVRRMLKRKRKSVSQTDEIEDGARAAIIEEAISILIFNKAKKHKYFKHANTVDLSLLKQVMDLASELEVSKCTSRQWKDAILQGYECFNKLNDEKGGKIIVSLDNESVTFESL